MAPKLLSPLPPFVEALRPRLFAGIQDISPLTLRHSEGKFARQLRYRLSLSVQMGERFRAVRSFTLKGAGMSYLFVICTACSRPLYSLLDKETKKTVLEEERSVFWCECRGEPTPEEQELYTSVAYRIPPVDYLYHSFFTRLFDQQARSTLELALLATHYSVLFETLGANWRELRVLPEVQSYLAEKVL